MEAKNSLPPSDHTPQWIVQQLDQQIAGQEEAKRSLAAALWWNKYRARLAAAGHNPRKLPPKQNVLLIGPTGTGKTALARAAARVMGVPFFSTSATSYSITGLVGLDPEDVITGLLDAAQGDVDRAKVGIVLLDETDKLKRRQWGDGHADVGGESMQQSWLSMLENAEAFVRGRTYDRVRVNTQFVTFIGTGVFEDLRSSSGPVFAEDIVRLGFLPEFVARFSMRVRMQDLNLQQLRQIADDASASPIKQLQHLFELHGIELVVEKGAVDILVERGMENGLGARGLEQAVWERCNQLVSELPQLIERSITRVVVDRVAVETGNPWMVPGEIAKSRQVVNVPDPPPQSDMVEWHPNLPRVSDTTGWSKSQVATHYKALLPNIRLDRATPEAKEFWKAFESQHEKDMRPVVRLSEVLSRLTPTGSVQEFFNAWQAEPHVDERFVIFSMLSERYRGNLKKPKSDRPKRKPEPDGLF